MGGGGVMRAATKAAGIAAASGGLRGVASEPYRRSAAACNAAAICQMPASMVSSAEDVKRVDHVQQNPNCVFDDWEFAGGEEEFMVEAAEPMARVVFGGAPSLQEAREATSDLSSALEKAYLSQRNSAGSESQISEAKACVSCETGVPTVVPKHAIQAFKFLNESSAAQSVVASIACDPNVWNAVLQNNELQGFIRSQNSSPSFADFRSMVDSVAENNLSEESSPKSTNGPSASWKAEFGNVFRDVLDTVKVSVVDMMNCLSDYFQSLFGGHESYRISANAGGSARLSATEDRMEKCFMGLAIMAILVILLKRVS